VHYEPLDDESRFGVIDEKGIEQYYHKSHMLWKAPSDHTINNRQYAAELQVTYIQYATNREVILSLLFDTDLELKETDARRLKTCFVDSFELDYFAAATSADPPRDAGKIKVPLKQLINYLPDTYAMYYGSQTIPPCSESVTWLVNTSPHVITKQ
jgi:carbonic anhydrase